MYLAHLGKSTRSMVVSTLFVGHARQRVQRDIALHGSLLLHFGAGRMAEPHISISLLSEPDEFFQAHTTL